MRPSALTVLLLILPSSFAFSAESNSDIAALTQEIAALRQQIGALETRVSELEASATSPASATPLSKEDSKEKRNWLESMRVELKKAEVRASGAWTTSSAWQKIETGITEEEAIAILGEPMRRKFSVRKDTDEILIYEGDLSGNGDSVYGEVRIYKGKVRRFLEPDLPEPL